MINGTERVRFGILGPLRVVSELGTEVVVRSRHERTVLAVLLVRAGQAVPADHLVAALWPTRPPASHVSNLQTYVSRLRERLSGVAIENVNGCYRLRVDSHAVDVSVFRREVASARTALATDDPVAAVAAFRRGLALWRGRRPLADLSIERLEPELVQLESEWLSAVEDCVDAELSLGGGHGGGHGGQHGTDLVAELYRLVAEQPLRERLHSQLMVALCQIGRRVDALTAYQNARERLVGELGVEPGPQLQNLHRAVLRGEEIAARTTSAAAPEPAFPVCQLPAAVDGFVGRAATVERLSTMVRPSASVVPVVVISGQPGVGKSATAMLVSHRVRAAFPDGQLFAHLAGASAAPREPAEVLAELLRALGLAGSAIPRSLPALSAAYRARLADRRVLVVLDDASEAAQVRALVPGTPGSAVLVTSRNRLSGLTDARHLSLGPLDDDEARTLLEHVVGRERVADEPGPTARIAASCGNLPLALRIAGTRLATRTLRLATLADRLDDEHRRLDELAVADQQVRASIGLSVASLSAPARAAFAGLGRTGPVSVGAWAVAALLDRPHAEDVIDELVEANLLEPVEGAEPRYRLHDLLRVYAAESAADQAGAHARLVAATVARIDAAARLLPRTLTWSWPPAWAPAGAPARAPLSTSSASCRSPDDAVAWFAAEREFLVHAVAGAVAAGADRAALLIAERLTPFLWVHGDWGELGAVQRQARRAAERTGDVGAAARAGFLSGLLSLVGGQLADAAVGFARARAAFERLEDRHGQACVLSDEAILCGYRGRPEESVTMARRAIALFNAEGDAVGAILASPDLSSALRGLGRFAEALEVDRAAAAAARTVGAAELVVARCLNALAMTQLLAGDARDAYAAAAESVQRLRAIDDRYVLVAAVRHLASAAMRLGRRAEAVRLLEESHELAVQVGDRLWATGIERDIAVSWIGDGRAAAAVPVLRRCLGTFAEMELRSAQAATFGMLAHAYRVLGERRAAQEAERAGALLADPLDARTPVLSEIVMSLAVPA